jgi:hypothetical protein
MKYEVRIVGRVYADHSRRARTTFIPEKCTEVLIGLAISISSSPMENLELLQYRHVVSSKEWKVISHSFSRDLGVPVLLYPCPYMRTPAFLLIKGPRGGPVSRIPSKPLVGGLRY